MTREEGRTLPLDSIVEMPPQIEDHLEADGPNVVSAEVSQDPFHEIEDQNEGGDGQEGSAPSLRYQLLAQGRVAGNPTLSK